MSLTAANPGGWSLNEVLTSAQMTHLQNELLKAIDGVNGGTYTLASPLEFAGADVRIAADLEVLNGGEINIQNGGALNVLAGGIIDFSGDLHISSGGELVVENGGLLTMQNGSDMTVAGTALIDLLGTLDVNGTGSIEVGAGGAININAGGDINVTSADVTINAGGQIVLNGGGLLIGATGFIQANGGDIALASGSFINAAAGAGINVEDAEDITIAASNETFSTTLVPISGFLGWGLSALGGGRISWEQNNVGAAHAIVFPLAIPPGDDLVNLFIGLNGENGHAGLPATMPRCEIIRCDVEGTFTVLAANDDTSASVAAYENWHFILLENGSLTSGAMPILASVEPLYAVVYGEFGANAIIGLEITSITGNITARSYRGDEAVFT